MLRRLVIFIFTICTNNIFSQSVSIISQSSPSCYGQCNGSITFSVIGASGPFSVSITNTSSCSNPTTSIFSTQSITINNLCACPSAYVFSFYDGSSSLISSQNIPVTQPSLFNSYVSVDKTICYGDSVQIYSSGYGGTPPYTFSWTPSTFTTGGPFYVKPTSIAQYIAYVSDNNGCTTNPKTITINVYPPLTSTVTSTSPSCTSCCDGSAQINVNSGSFPYTVLLTPGNYTTSPVNGLCNGTYTYCAFVGLANCKTCNTFTLNSSIGIKEYFN